MSEHSLIIALKYGEKLKEFDDIAQAEKYFISYKDELLNRLEAISGQLDGFSPDYTIESLKNIENYILNCIAIIHSVNYYYRKNNLKVLCLYIGVRSLLKIMRAPNG